MQYNILFLDRRVLSVNIPLIKIVKFIITIYFDFLSNTFGTKRKLVTSISQANFKLLELDSKTFQTFKISYALSNSILSFNLN